MSRGRRYEEPKLNMKKVFAVIIAIIVFIMCIFIVKGLLTKNDEQEKIVSKDYFAAYKDNKWGVIDSTGTVVIDPSYAEMIVVPNSKNDVFLCTYVVNFETGEYKTKALNSKNEEILTGYDKVEPIQNIDENNNVWYVSNALKVSKDGKYGLISLDGKELISCQYEEITGLGDTTNNNVLKILKDGKYGILDTEGKEVVKPEYADVEIFNNNGKTGIIVKNSEGKCGLVDFLNNKILDTNYDEIKNIYNNDLYVVKKDGKEILIKKDGTEVLSSGYDKIEGILKNSDSGIIFVKDNKYGVMKQTGEIVINAEYDELKESKSGILIAKKNDKYGIIDLEKNEKVGFIYNSISYNEKSDLYVAEKEDFTNDILDNTFEVKQSGILIDLNTDKGYIELRQGDDYNYFDLKLSNKKASEIFTSRTLFVDKKDGKYGFVDKDGNVIVDYIYDDATEQNDYGYCGIKKDGKWGSIDSKGNIIQEPIYDLEDYLKIDFIGRWHYGKDINMNYYNQI